MLEGQNPFRLPFTPQVVPERMTLDVDVLAITFSPDGKALATSNREGKDYAVNLWDPANGRKLSSIPHRRAFDLAFSPDGKVLAVSSDEFRGKQLIEKKLFDGRIIRTTAHDWPGVIQLWDPITWRPATTIRINDGGTRVAFAPDGRVLATGAGWHDKNHTVYLWNPTTGELQRSMTAKDDPSYVSALAFSPDGKLLATGSYEGVLKVWDLATAKAVVSLKVNDLAPGYDRGVNALSFSPDGKTLAVASREPAVTLIDIPTGMKQRTLKFKALYHARSVQFSPDGKLLAVIDTRLQLWDPSTGTIKANIRAHRRTLCAWPTRPTARPSPRVPWIER